MPKVFAIIVGMAWLLSSSFAFAQPQPAPSCEEQVAELRVVLSFVRVSRQQLEENAGRVVVTLQKDMTTLSQKVDEKKATAGLPDGAPMSQRDEEKKEQ